MKVNSSTKNSRQCPYLLSLILGIWGVDEDNNAQRYDEGGISFEVSGIKLKQIDSGPEGVVLGVTLNDVVYCRSGILPSKPLGTLWKRIHGCELKYISCGRLGCWGVAPDGSVHYREGVTRHECRGKSWVCSKFTCILFAIFLNYIFGRGAFLSFVNHCY